MYKHLDPTILQSKTMRYVIGILEKAYYESRANKTTRKHVEHILGQFRRADNVRKNKIGQPLNEKNNRQ